MGLLQWSTMSFFVTTAATIICQRMARRSKHFAHINEFACTAMWIAWCAEQWVLDTYASKALSTTVVFLMVFLAPFVFQGARCNPCTLLYEYLTSPKPPRYALAILLVDLAAILAAAVGMRALWTLLGGGGSLEHSAFFDDDTSRELLGVGLMEGCLVELVATFCVYATQKFVSSEVGLAFVQASLVASLSLYLGHYTGVILNPLVAPALYLMAGNYRAVELLLVYWVGPLLGAGLATLVPELGPNNRDDLRKSM